MSDSKYRLSRSVYSLLLLGYPRAFRKRFAEQMLADFHDLLISDSGKGPVRGRIAAWKVSARDLLRSVPRERLGGLHPDRGVRQTKPTRKNRPMMISSVLEDVRHTFRMWWKSPAFIVSAALTIALGIGATTTVFSVANSLLIRTPTGVRNPEALVTVFSARMDGSSVGLFSYPTFRDLRDANSGLNDFGGFALFTASVSTGTETEPQRAAGLVVSANYFTILGTRPMLGRFFLPEEDVSPNTHPVAVIGHRLWLRRFGADSSIVGRTVSLNRHPFTVIGIAEEGFQGHVTGYDFGLWVPMAMAETVSGVRLDSRRQMEVGGIGRLAADASLSQVSASFDVTVENLRTEYPDDYGERRMVVTPYSGMIEFAKTPVTLFMALLFGISGIVLLIACVNVAGMLLSRASARSREIAIRMAVGARRGRVVRQLLTESVMLFLVGGGLGTAFAFWATGVLGALRPPVPLPFAIDFTPDPLVLGFTIAIAFSTGMVFGLAPALRVTKPDLVTSLKDDAGGAVGRREKMRSVFVIAQITGSVILLVVAGVFVRALGRSDSVDLGFEPDNVHVFTVDVSLHQYSQEERGGFFRELHERASSLPGVESASLTSALPLGFTYIGTVFVVPGREAEENGGQFSAGINAVSSDYFETLEIDIVAGRSFSDADRRNTHGVLIVNEFTAARFWPGENAVGKVLKHGGADYEVVGVAANGKYRAVGEAIRPMVYEVFPQTSYREASLVLRSPPGRTNIAREVMEISRGLDPDLPAQTNAPYERVIGLSLLPNRAAATAAGAFGLLGLLLAGVGLYGVLSYSVSLRLREIGIRIALGSDNGAILKIVLMDGLRLVGIGLGVGFPLALGIAFLARSLLFGLSPADPITFGGIAALFVGVGAIASYLPARRATRTDPMDALRCE